MVARYYIEDATLKPSLAVTLTDNWIQINLRYITDYKLRRATKHLLFNYIEKNISETTGKVTLASATLQLLQIPELEVNLKK
jgi:hypothetical protein